MPLMGSLYVGNSGLQTHQNALNTTAHNMSNGDTTGYVRQQALFGTSNYNTISVNAKSVANQQLGLGVNYSAARQVRDYFLDQTYRRESGRCAFYETSFNAMEEVETILGELNQTAFKETMDNLWYSIQELYKTPDNSVVQGLFVQSASAFVKRSQSIYQGLSDYQDNLNIQVQQTVTKINDYGRKIKELNDQIRVIECGGIEHANDLRDARNQLIDELSAMGNIQVTEDADSSVTIKFEGEVFVARDVVYEMGMKVDETTGFVTPFWPQNTPYTLNDDGTRKYDISESGRVFDERQIISSDLNTDIGQLKSILLARGDHRGNFTDLQNKDTYNSDIAQSVIMNVQAEFDQLIHGVVTKINDILKEASDPDSGYLCNPDGTPLQLFQRVTGYTGDEITTGNRTETLFTTANIIVNQDIVEQPTLLSFIKDDQKVDFETIEKMKKAFQEESYSLNPNVIKKSNFMDYYSDLVSQVGNSGYVYKSIMTNQQQTVQITENARQGVVGVSTDEELSNMIRFQNGYNAASRYINAISEMLEHLINKLA